MQVGEALNAGQTLCALDEYSQSIPQRCNGHPANFSHHKELRSGRHGQLYDMQQYMQSSSFMVQAFMDS